MNIAFVTVLLFIILSPGLIFRRSYFSGVFSAKFRKYKIIDEIALSILPGIIMNFIGYYLVILFTDYKINLTYLGYLLSGVKGDELITKVYSNMQIHLTHIVLYFLLIGILASLLGHLLRLFVRKCKLDLHYRTFRSASKWHYIFSGEYPEFVEFKDSDLWKRKDFDLILTDVLVDIGKEKIIYSGILHDYNLTSDGEIQSLLLDLLSIDDSGDIKLNERLTPGNVFHVPSIIILDINIRHIKISETGTAHTTDD